MTTTIIRGSTKSSSWFYLAGHWVDSGFASFYSKEQAYTSCSKREYYNRSISFIDIANDSALYHWICVWGSDTVKSPQIRLLSILYSVLYISKYIQVLIFILNYFLKKKKKLVMAEPNPTFIFKKVFPWEMKDPSPIDYLKKGKKCPIE